MNVAKSRIQTSGYPVPALKPSFRSCRARPRTSSRSLSARMRRASSRSNADLVWLIPGLGIDVLLVQPTNKEKTLATAIAWELKRSDVSVFIVHNLHRGTRWKERAARIFGQARLRARWVFWRLGGGKPRLRD